MELVHEDVLEGRDLRIVVKAEEELSQVNTISCELCPVQCTMSCTTFDTDITVQGVHKIAAAASGHAVSQVPGQVINDVEMLEASPCRPQHADLLLQAWELGPGSTPGRGRSGQD